MFINILLSELILFTAIFGLLTAVFYGKKVFNFNGKAILENEGNAFGTPEENIYDTGYLSDLEDFNTRISQIKDDLNAMPAVEIITNDYEAEMNV